MALTVSKLANQVGLSPDAIRYYERIGMLPHPERTPAGYRLYDEDAVERVRFVKGVQRLGLRLSEIRELLDIRDRGLCPCGHTEDLLRRRIGELDEEIERLGSLRAELVRMVEDRSSDGAAQCVGELLQIQGVKR